MTITVPAGSRAATCIGVPRAPTAPSNAARSAPGLQLPPGGAVTLTLYWRALRPMQNAYTVFNQVIDLTTAAKAGQVLSARDCLRVLVRNHLEVLLGAESDFIPVMLYEWRSLSEVQRQAVNELRREYEAVWVPVLQALNEQGELQGNPSLARLMIFGALNWAVQWYEPGRRSSLDDLTEAALQLFLKEPA